MEISFSESNGLANDIINFLAFLDIKIDKDIQTDLADLIHYHNGLNFSRKEKKWFIPNYPDEFLEFNKLILQSVKSA